MRRTRWGRRPISSKPETDPESVDVDATVISVKGMRIIRGDLANPSTMQLMEALVRIKQSG